MRSMENRIEDTDTLGIDWGSSAVRAFFWSRALRQGTVVQNKDRTIGSGRFEIGDFSSRIYPFDADKPVYLGEKVDPEREWTSSKFVLYSMADATDELLEEYHLVKKLLSMKNDLALQDRLLQGLKALFLRLKRRVDAVCRTRQLRIGTIGLSIPSQWTTDFEKLYRMLIADVFEFPADNIYFIYETEALAHYLCRDHLSLLIKQRDIVHHDVISFFDFGGHNMNTCTVNVAYGRDNAPCFYMIGRAKGAGGGSEHWEYHIGMEALRFIQLSYRQILSPMEKQRILDQFNSQKCDLGPGQMDDFYFKGQRDHGELLNVNLSAETLTECFNDALKGPLELAAEKIRELSSMKDVNPRVVVSGGTSRHEGLKSRLQEMCRDNDLPPPVFTDDLEILYDSVKIAQGTAYAVAEYLKVEEFLDRGAAIGLQRLQHGTRHDPNPERLWDNEAAFLLSKNRQKDFLGYLNGRDQFKLICDPFFEVQSPESNSLYYNRCYDILDLGKPNRGWWCFSLSLTGSGDDMSLVLERSMHYLDKTKLGLFDRMAYSIYYCRSGNCIHLGSDGRDNECLLSKVKEYPQSKKKTKLVEPNNEDPPAIENGSSETERMNIQENETHVVTLEDEDEYGNEDDDESEYEGDEDYREGFQFCFNTNDLESKAKLAFKLMGGSIPRSASSPQIPEKSPRRISSRCTKGVHRGRSNL